MVKKLTALLVALLMLFTFASAGAADFLGAWYLASYESNGITLNPADMGMEMSFTLNGDGTGVITVPGEEDMAATWTADGANITITAANNPLTFALTDDGKMVAQQEETKMIFGREAPAPGFVPAAAIAAADIAQFDGTWNITTVNAFGMIVPFSAMAEMGMFDGTILIQNGSVTSFGSPQAETGTLQDGLLVVASPLEGGGLEKTFSLLEDGTLSMKFMDMLFYCEKAELAK